MIPDLKAQITEALTIETQKAVKGKYSPLSNGDWPIWSFNEFDPEKWQFLYNHG